MCLILINVSYCSLAFLICTLLYSFLLPSKQDKAFKIHNTPKVIKHQAALPKVPDYFWDDWQSKVRYITGALVFLVM